MQQKSTHTPPPDDAVPPTAGPAADGGQTPTPATRASALYALLRERAVEPAPELSRPVLVAGRPCGRATLAACDALRHLPGATVRDDALELGAGLAPGAALDGLLARVAQRLREADCLRGWRDELLDVLDEQGRPVGAIERAAVRPLGLLTRAVHLNAWTPDGRLWIARRALSKSTDPGMWDTLVGGLAGSGEDLDLALVRECGEEAGLDAPDIQAREPMRTVLRMHRRLPEGYQVEDLMVSRCVLPAHVRPANRDGEVMEIATVDAERALAMVAAGEFTLEAALVIADELMSRPGARS
ncbi:NUDIX hydrolase [Bordetella genomosp. 10]|uniref:NUDIX hydrolase n=1 Tax=Bordetella genomosp. 10 TaxID=1416804 RepID=A0A261SIY6_9BORD|nr:NUDIX domain-containing protein [Bordetella genomosp. 10]OZI36912.1 NUDIX hydrolase [Bordetella genomosp. 10]